MSMKSNLYSLMALSMMGAGMYHHPAIRRTRYTEYKPDRRTDSQKIGELLVALRDNQEQHCTMFTIQGFHVGGNTLKSTTKWIRKTLADSGFSPNSSYDEIAEKISNL